MKTANVLLTVLFAAMVVAAQEGAGLRGVVTVGGRPAAGATVTVTGPAGSENKVTKALVTDDNGNYYLGFEKPGNYSVKVVRERPGRRSEIGLGKSVLLNFAFETELNIELGEFSSRLEEMPSIKESVTVSAGESQPIEQVSKTVDTISAQEMRDRADFSLIESLRTIPGFRVAQSGGFGRLATVKTRGLRNQDTAILVDGIRFRDVTAITGDASAFLSDFTLTSVNKVEVLRGSGSSLYGTNAIGGTIDFQTPTAKSGTHGQIGGASGGLGLGRFRGNISHATDNGKFGGTAGVSRTAYTKGIDGQDNAYNTNLQTRIDVNPWDKTSISGRIFFSDAKVRLNSSPDTLGTLPVTNAAILDAKAGVNFVFDANDPDNNQKSRFFDGQIAVNQIINEKFIVSGYFQGLTTKRTNDNGTLGAGFQSASTSVFDGTVHTGNVHFNWMPGRENTLTAGYEFESERLGNDGKTPSGTANFFTKAGQNSNTFYVQDLVSLLGGDLQLAGGARVQRFSLDRPGFSLVNAPYSNLTLSDPPTAYTFDGAASYFVRKSGTKFRAHVGNGYRVPSLYERFGTFLATFLTPNRFVPIGAPDLKPEKTIAFDGGIEQNLAKDRVRLSTTYFYTKLIDIIGYGSLRQPDPFGRVNSLSGGGYLNTKGGIARGGEFSVKAQATRSTDMFASYTFTNTVQRAVQIAGNSNLKTLGVPEHQFTFVATQRYKRFWVNFDFLATSTYLAPIFSNTYFRTYVYRFDGNRKGDLTGGYTFGFKKEKMTLRLYGTIENVFDQEYYENGFRTAGATGRVGVSFGF